MNDNNKLQHRQGNDLAHPTIPDRYLMSKPQPLGFLPTMWFWNQHARSRRGKLQGIFLTAVVLGAFPFATLIQTIGYPLTAVAMGVWFCTVYGGAEYFLRRAIERRRALAAKVGPDALQPARTE